MRHPGKPDPTSSSFFNSLHESIGDPDRNIEIGDLVLIGLAGDEILHIRVVHAQDGHIGAAAGAALGNFAEGVVIHAQEAHRTGSLAGRAFHQ